MFKLIRNLSKKEWVIVMISTILIFFQVYLELKMPDFMSKITRLVQTKGSLMSDILINGFYMLVCAFLSLLCAVIVGYLISYVSSKFSFITRKKLFDKVENLSMHEVKKFKTGSLITRTTNDITQVEMLIGMGLQLLVKAFITAIWAVAKILNKSMVWSALTGASVFILLSAVVILMFIVVPRFKIIQKLTDKINSVARENLNGIRVIRAFNAEGYQEEKFESVNNDLTNNQLFNQKAFAILSPIMYLVMYFLALLIYFVGAYLIKDAQMLDKLTIFGDMIVFSSYSLQVIMSFLMLAMIFMILPRASVSAKRINEVLDEKISVLSGSFNGDTKKTGEVEFRNVSFKYPDAEEYLLKNISFKINKGEVVAFIGSTGSGKSTLINLIPRFYDVTDGEILIDGVNVKEYNLEALNNKIAYVSQKAVIFDGTLKSNIKYGKSNKKITDKDVLDSINIAQVSEFVDKLDDGINSHISAKGTNLSGGQKQRVSIARALARGAEVYIFDDSFSALDYKTDSIVRKNIKKHMKDATCLIVATRIGTIMNADKIVVLDNGNCVGIGTHQELLKNCSVYKQIALSQFRKEELEHE